MITIVKDGRKILCSKNTYKSMYERMGYEILESKEDLKEKSSKIVEKAKEKELITPYDEFVKTNLAEETTVTEPKETIKKTKEQRNTKNKKKGE